MAASQQASAHAKVEGTTAAEAGWTWDRSRQSCDDAEKHARDARKFIIETILTPTMFGKLRWP